MTGQSNIAGDQGIQARGGKDFAAQGGGGGLSVGAGNGKDLSLEEAGGQF